MIGAKSKDPEDVSFAMPLQGILTMHSRLGAEPEKSLTSERSPYPDQPNRKRYLLNRRPSWHPAIGIPRSLGIGKILRVLCG
jgi:hypothetical protein